MVKFTRITEDLLDDLVWYKKYFGDDEFYVLKILRRCFETGEKCFIASHAEGENEPVEFSGDVFIDDPIPSGLTSK